MYVLFIIVCSLHSFQHLSYPNSILFVFAHIRPSTYHLASSSLSQLIFFWYWPTMLWVLSGLLPSNFQLFVYIYFYYFHKDVQVLFWWGHAATRSWTLVLRVVEPLLSPCAVWPTPLTLFFSYFSFLKNEPIIENYHLVSVFSCNKSEISHNLVTLISTTYSHIFVSLPLRFIELSLSYL